MAGSHLVLVGLMGAGKTSVGRACAERLGREFVDTDDVVIAHAGMSIDDIWRTGGERHFRDIERTVIADVCAAPEPLVIACGGGSVLDPENRARLRASGVVVWLRAPATVLAGRVGDGSSRPLLRNDPEGSLSRLERLREPAYEAAAHVKVDTDDVDVDAVAGRVLDGYEAART